MLDNMLLKLQASDMCRTVREKRDGGCSGKKNEGRVTQTELRGYIRWSKNR
jgi:hypothetical protein